MTLIDKADDPVHSPGADCPICFGCGEITGPESRAYRMDPEDPYNVVVRVCEECDGTGVVTAVRRAGLEAESMQRVMAIVDKVFPEGAAAAQHKGRDLARDLGLTL